MDEKRELNDILIGGEDEKAKQSKKLILLIVGIVVLLLACVVIFFSMSSAKEEPIVLSESADSMVPEGFGNVEVAPSDDDKFEQIVQEIKKKQQESEPVVQAPVPEVPLARAEAPRATMPERRASAPRANVQSAPQAPRAATYRGNNGDIAESGYYLQVGAFSKTPNSAFMDNINRYSYRVQEVMINSKVITRYLVGPYPSREAAQRDYANVARDITTPVYFQID